MPDMSDGSTFPAEFRTKATDSADEPQTSKQASPSETQLTLQELREKLENEVAIDEGGDMYRSLFDEEIKDIVKVFQQALTSLKTEMEGMKKDSDVSDYWNGLNLGISECQRVIDNYSPSLRQANSSDDVQLNNGSPELQGE